MATPPNQLGQQPSSQPSYLKWILIGCSALLLFWIVVVIAAFGVWFYSRPSPERTTRRSIFGDAVVKLVDNHGIETVPKTWSSCTALAPAEWTIIGNEQRVGIGVDLTAPDQTMFASYGIVALTHTTETLGTDYYGTATPERFLQTMLESGGATGFELEKYKPVGGRLYAALLAGEFARQGVSRFRAISNFRDG